MVNYTEDMGMEGLRNYKRRLAPYYLKPKYRVLVERTGWKMKKRMKIGGSAVADSVGSSILEAESAGDQSISTDHSRWPLPGDERGK